MPDVVRSCETRSKDSKRGLEKADVVSQISERLEEQQVVEA